LLIFVDARLGFRVELIFGARYGRPKQGKHGHAQDEHIKFMVRSHK
jgi:hypothetical protein